MATKNTEPTNQNCYLIHRQQQGMLPVQNLMSHQTVLSSSAMVEPIALK